MKLCLHKLLFMNVMDVRWTSKTPLCALKFFTNTKSCFDVNTTLFERCGRQMDIKERCVVDVKEYATENEKSKN